MTQPKILITGCGASGTKFTTELLRQAGVMVSHERIGPRGMVSWYAAPGYKVCGRIPFNGHALGDFYPDPYVILHQTRHPLGVISSASQAWSPKSWLFISQNIDVSWTRNMTHAAMVYWLNWNQLAEGISQHTYQLESLSQPDIWAEFCKWIRHPELVDKREELFGRVNRNTNSRKDHYKKLTWRDLKFTDPRLAEAVQAQAVKYGYEIE